MQPADARWLAWCLRVVRGAARLASPAARGRWLAEWNAELVHWWSERSAAGTASRALLMRRTVLAVTDALRTRLEGGHRADPPPSRRADYRGGTPRGSLLEGLFTDARFALRSWRKQPVLIGALMLTLSLGIAANTAVEPIDPPVFAVVPVLVLAITALAIWLPAVRATQVDPVTVLREE